MTRIALRLQRTSLLAYGALSLAVLVINSGGFSQIAGSTAAQREAFARQVEALGQQISYILPLPVRVDTIGGYLAWRAFGGLVIFFAFWGVMGGTAIRGEEERGLVEQWSAAGVSKTRLLATRAAAFAIAGVGALALTSGAAWLAARLQGESLDASALSLQSLIVLATMLVFFAAGLLAAQLRPTRREAAGLASVVMLVLFFLNSLARSAPALRPYRWLSPFYLYDRSQPLVPGGRVDTISLSAELALAAALLLLAWIAFRQRDTGSTLWVLHRPVAVNHLSPLRRALVQRPVVRGLYEHRLGLLAWAGGLGAMGLVIAQAAKPAATAIEAMPSMRFFLGHGADPAVGYIATAWFGTAGVLLCAYAITAVAGWSAEDAGGRLEIALSTPTSRRRLIAERALELTGALLLLITTSAVVIAVAGSAGGLELDLSRLALASLLLLPLALAFGGAGAAAAAFRPRAAVATVGTALALSYLILFLGPLFKAPAWLLNLSAFKLYGEPLTQGIDTGGLVVLLAAVAAGFWLAGAAMQRRDVGS